MASRITSYRPRPRPPHKTPQPKRPRPRIIKPPPDRENFGPTCLRKSALWELTIPLVFNHSDLPRSIGVDAYDAVNDLFLADAFDLVPVAQGLPDEITLKERRSISEKAAWRPYHCAWYCLRPSALVRGSAKVASSWIMEISGY
jgi:hypothetical protein